jgi:hypothetical protein
VLVFHHPELARDARAAERDMPDGIAGDEIKRAGPDLEALKVLMLSGEDGKCGVREGAIALNCHLTEAPRTQAGNGGDRLIATQPQTPQAHAS